MIIPSIDIMNGRAVQLRQGKEFLLDGGDPLERLEQFRVAGEVAVIDLDAALGTGSNRELIRQLVRRADCRVGGGVRDVATARAWLDAGAASVIVGTAASPEFFKQLPRGRVVAAVDARAGRVVTEGWRTHTRDAVVDRVRRLAPFVGGFLFTQVEHEGELAGFNRELVAQVVKAARGVRVTAAGGITTAKDVAWLDSIGADAQVGRAVYEDKLSLGEAVAAPLVRTPADGLWPTVVVDPDGRALGLAWSNRETVARAVEERRGIYWSRSRQEVWIKGATSGAAQELLRVDLDCDRDALRFTVVQREPGFCHRGTRACWPSGFHLTDLEHTLRRTVEVGEPASGTVKLVQDATLLSAKLHEEAGELAGAKGKHAVTHEAADLMYFTLVAMARGGVGLPDVERELQRRRRRESRRPMEKKETSS